MFAYCGNNPVNCCDPSGYYIRTGFSTNAMIESNATPTPPSAVVKYSPPVEPRKTLIDVIFNDDVSAVLEAENFAFYKGVPVIKADLPEGSGFSCIVIFLDEEIVTNNDYGARTLMHEYGHVKHLAQIGLPSYISTVVLPSSIGAYLSNRGLISIDYYSLPWEQIAERLGGVEGRTYESWSGSAAIIYWIYTCAVGTLN